MKARKSPKKTVPQSKFSRSRNMALAAALELSGSEAPLVLGSEMVYI